MRTLALAFLVATAALAAPAFAQAPEPPANAAPPYIPPPTSSQNAPDWDGDTWRRFPGPELGASSLRGYEALMMQDYERAERVFEVYLRRKPGHGEANLYMGVAKMELGKWDDARKHLEIAAKRRPKHPDPKSRLGVAYAKLGDTAAALGQRAELVRMTEACRNGCRYAPYIRAGISMIDKALAEN